MKQDIRRLIITLLILIGVAIPLRYAVAYSLNDLVQVNGIVNNETYDKVCKAQKIIDGLAALQNGYAKDLIKATIQEFKNAAVNYAIQLVLCNIIPDKALEVAAGIGAKLNFKSPNCNMEINSSTTTLLKQQALRALRSKFEARCLGRQMFSTVEDDIRRIMQENGPDGGQAYVSDWTQLPAIEDARAINRFNAILVNTPICPYFRSRVYAYFSVPQSYIDSPPPINKSGFKVDGGNPFTLQGACSAPNGLTPTSLDANFHNAGGFDALQLLMRPENNFDDFVQMAQEELSKQRVAVVQGAMNEAMGTGIRGLYTCIREDSAGHCIEQTIQQPAGGVANMDLAIKQGEIDWMTNSQDENSMMGDIRQRIISGMLDIGSNALAIPIEFDSSAQELIDAGNATPTPGAPDDPNSPENLACTGGNPLCFCVKNNPEFQTIRNWVADATRAAITAHSDLIVVTPNGTSVRPGQNLNFLTAICETSTGGTLGCHPNAGSDDEIVVDTGTMTISVDVITSDNVIRMPGQTIAACQPGVQ